ncbi:thioesterase [Vibrio cholerae]|nr:thioesterase [Vibrio cholerae]
MNNRKNKFYKLSDGIWAYRQDKLNMKVQTVILAPYGGGNPYSMEDWAQTLFEQGVQVLALQYPGRGPRIKEPQATSIRSLAQSLAKEVSKVLGKRTVYLFGHSMGALICHEIAHYLEADDMTVAGVILSGARRPQQNTMNIQEIHNWSKEEWRSIISETIPDSLNEQMTDAVMNFFIKSLKHDYLMVAMHKQSDLSLHCPMYVIGGQADPWVEEKHLRAWSAHARGLFEFESFAGEHFYYKGQIADILLRFGQVFPLWCVQNKEIEPPKVPRNCAHSTKVIAFQESHEPVSNALLEEGYSE